MWIQAWKLPGHCLGDRYYVWYEPVRITTEKLEAPAGGEPAPQWMLDLEEDLEF